MKCLRCTICLALVAIAQFPFSSAFLPAVALRAHDMPQCTFPRAGRGLTVRASAQDNDGTKSVKQLLEEAETMRRGLGGKPADPLPVSVADAASAAEAAALQLQLDSMMAFQAETNAQKRLQLKTTQGVEGIQAVADAAKRQHQKKQQDNSANSPEELLKNMRKEFRY